MSRNSAASNKTKLSRRDFARAAALAAATAAIPQTATVHASEPAQSSALSAAGEAHLQAILEKYGKRLSDEQRTELRRLIAQQQKTSETLRSFALDNSDEPAMTFHIYRSDRR